MTLRILHFVRNKVKAHGYLQSYNAENLWCFTLYFAVAFMSFLHLPEFYLDFAGERLAAGYSELEYYMDLDGLFRVSDGVPCLLWKAEKGKKVYMNFFGGAPVVCDIPEEGEAPGLIEER